MCVNVLTYNIRSLRRNLDLFLASEDVERFDVIVFTETWLYPHEEGLFRIKGYTCHFVSNTNYRSGGVMVCVRDRLPSVTIHKFSKNSDFVIVEIKIGNSSLRVAGCYRSPTASVSDFDSFCAMDLPEALGLLRDQNEAIFCGDMNIDLLEGGDRVERYMEVIEDTGLILCNDGEPTRLAENGGSLIDHVFVRLTKGECIGSKINELKGVTDHQAVETQILFNEKIRERNGGMVVDYEMLQIEVALCDWSEVLAEKDPDKITDLLTDKCKALMTQCSMPRVMSRCMCPTRDWMTHGLVKCLRRRDKLYDAWKRTGKIADKTYFLAYKNRLRGLLRRARSDYYQGKLAEAGTSSRKIWKVVNGYFRGGGGRDGLDPEQTGHSLNEINEFFASLGARTAGQLGEVSDSLEMPDYTVSMCHEFEIPAVGEVIKVINGLKGGKAGGLDGITSRMIKQNVGIFGLLLQHLINEIFRTGHYPARFKIAKLRPIHKSGNLTDLVNYRPISLLSCFNKVVEKIIAKRMWAHLDKNDILLSRQFGFRKGKSCEDAASGLLQAVTDALESGQTCVGVFLDISKAFDTVNHGRLICKMSKMGFSGRTIDLLGSYLTGRQQVFEHNGELSDSCNLTCGVPQGSVLGPLLFILYVNDLLRPFNNEDKFCFADDTAILIKDDNPETLCEGASEILTRVGTWLRLNGLVLNKDKTKVVAFSKRTTRGMSHNQTDIKIHSSMCDQINCSCSPIAEVSAIKYLGITLQSNLKYDRHVHNVINKLRSGIAVLARLTNTASLPLRKTVYFALIESHLNYMISIYGPTFVSHLSKLFTCQKKAIRLTARAPRLAHSGPLFKELQILDFNRLTCISILLRSPIPAQTRDRGLACSTRFQLANKIPVPIARRQATRRNKSFIFIKLFNWLPDDLRQKLSDQQEGKISRKTAKNCVKKFLLNLDVFALVSFV